MTLTLADLHGLPLLGGLDDTKKQALLNQLNVRTYKRNEAVVQKGQPSSELFFLLNGRLKVVDYAPSGREVGFVFIESGSHFGELALIDGKPRSASIVATEKSTVAMLTKQHARTLMYSEPSVSEKLLKQLANIIRQNNEHMVMLGNTSAPTRVNILLLKYASEVNGQLVIEKPPTQSEMAIMTNTTRETVSRTLSQLIEQGVIEKQGKKLTILEPDALEEMVLDC
ncbi:Crp/Fnr family transcriptional regulator [Marinobacterium arenosum]|uniref:Crp/Fnr family transcriptional regulator n=1 Tax=Marinobacterium arenosum TaxID=2862496 RepID=UPI001C938BFD|nr:Crp/Fnr family transcriptional regulator [Marinobacterium arenosum]MBY4679059.1 Crp/Fnr family transcriptional regulator [Marinobacterium arenosum]